MTKLEFIILAKCVHMAYLAFLLTGWECLLYPEI